MLFLCAARPTANGGWGEEERASRRGGGLKPSRSGQLWAVSDPTTNQSVGRVILPRFQENRPLRLAAPKTLAPLSLIRSRQFAETIRLFFTPKLMSSICTTTQSVSWRKCGQPQCAVSWNINCLPTHRSPPFQNTALPHLSDPSPPKGYRGASLIRNRLLLGPYSSPVPRGLGWSWGGGRFLMGEVPLYSQHL